MSETLLPSAKMALAAALLSVGSLAGCSSDSVNAQPSPASAYQHVIKPEDVKSVVRIRTKLFHRYLLDPAKASGQPLPDYLKWLSAVTSAVQAGGTPPGRESVLVVNAQLELKPYLQPMPQTKDLETLGAINEQVKLEKLGKILVDGFKVQSSSIRAVGASAIAEDIGQP